MMSFGFWMGLILTRSGQLSNQRFLSFDEMINSRLHSVECFNSIVNCSVFVFTLGLTER